MVKIKLIQIGKKNSRLFRLVAIDQKKSGGGRAIEVMGLYNPKLKPPHLVFKKERIDHWLSQGAQMTESVRKLLQS